jgi:hypothetical protein
MKKKISRNKRRHETIPFWERKDWLRAYKLSSLNSPWRIDEPDYLTTEAFFTDADYQNSPLYKESTMKATKTISIENLLQSIMEAVQFKFPNDPSAPGVLVSRLKNGEIYVSVVRFKAAFGKEKTVQYKAKEKTLGKALENIATQIVSDTVAKNPIEQLRDQLK